MSTMLYSLPAWRGAIVRSQADGTEIVVYQNGDEHLHYLTDAEGNWYRETANGYIEPCDSMTYAEREQARLRSPMLQAQQRRIATRNLAPRGLVILVNFKDCSFLESNSLEAMQEMHNGENYTYHGATGSAREYFRAQSGGEYVPTFDVVGPVTLSQNTRYYGANTRSGSDSRPEEMVVEACKAVDEQYTDIDFSNYDNDHDGFVDFVYIVYAGYNEAHGGPAYTIWPHNYYVYSGTKGIKCVIDGVQIDNYACSSELQGNDGSERCGIGTFCHEFSHVLGLPDLYSTSSRQDHKTLGCWDILDYGPYNNNGKTPPAYSAYERFFMGWTTPVVLNERVEQLTLDDIEKSNQCYLVSSTGQHNLNGVFPSPSEFYLLENKQQEGWNTYIPGHGLMITHIKYSRDRWASNLVNASPNNMGVDIVEADSLAPTSEEDEYAYLGKQGDLFPYKDIDYFTPYDNYPIFDIKESANGIISFSFIHDLNKFVVDEEGGEEIVAITTPYGITMPTCDVNELEPGLYIVWKKKDGKRIWGSKILIVE